MIEAIDGKKQHLTHVNVHPDQLDEMFLPKAIDYLYHNVESTTYEISWRSNHGSAYLCVDMTSATRLPGAPAAIQGRNKSNKVVPEMQQELMENVEWKEVARRCLKLWLFRSSERMQSMFTAWLKR